MSVMSRRILACVLALSSTIASSCGQSPAPEQPAAAEVERLTTEIVATHPFDDTSFTQGLEMEEEGTLLVGTGWAGESRIYRRTLDGQVLSSQDLEPHFFGEGITRHGDTVWQLTWQAGLAVERDAESLAEVDRVSYPGEGWGLCAFEDELVMSDGTAELRRLDPATFGERDRFTVTREGEPVAGLNELECIDGEIYANVFLTTDIVRIDAATGDVTAVIDASSLPNRATDDPNHVLNGIAAIPGTDRFLLTGKRWPDLYEVELVPAQ